MPAAARNTPRVGPRLPRRFCVWRGALLAAPLLLTLITLTAPSQAEVYRWVDAQGRIHFGDKPPARQGATSIEIESQPAPAQPAPDAAERRDKQQRLLRAWEEERRQREEQAAEAKHKQERRQRNCHIAKDRLRTYRDAGRLYDLDQAGQRRVLGDTEHRAALKEAEEAVAYWCG